MTALIDKLVQRRVEGRPDLKVIGFKFAMQERQSDDLSRCEVTGNPVGTDTCAVGYSCPCPSCRAYVAGLQPTKPAVVNLGWFSAFS